MDLSIIIVNHNTSSITKNAIESIIETVKEVKYEIIVVDNSTYSDEVFCFSDPRVRIFSGFVNKGFGNACNIGAKKALGKYILFLNPDTILNENTIDKAYNKLIHNDDIGALGVRQLLKSGKLDAGCKRGFPTPLNSLYYFLGLDKIWPESKRYGAYHQTFVDQRDVAEVDCLSGAFIMMRRDDFEFISGFDEDYFMYGEDIDLCYRLRQKGFMVLYYGEVFLTHLKGESGSSSLVCLKHFYQSMQIFYDKHYRFKYNFLVGALVKLGIKLKYLLARIKFLRNGGKKR